MSKFKARLHEKMKDAEMMPKLDLPVVIGRLQSLKRYDAEIAGGCECCGSWVDLEEYSNGDLVRWEDIEKLIEGLKKDNAR
jgi:hypothetical protein